MPRAQKPVAPVPDANQFVAVSGNFRHAAHEAPSRDQVARRAYELFLARGGEHGHDQEDWLQAERELSLGRFN